MNTAFLHAYDFKKFITFKYIIIVAIGLFFFIFARSLIMATLLILLGAFSTIYKRYFSIGLDLELCTLCAIAIGSAYGSIFGMISGGLSMFLSLFLNGHLMENTFFAVIKVATYVGLGFAAGIFVANPLLLSIIYTFIADVICVSIAANTGGNPMKLVVFLFTHTLIAATFVRAFLPLVKIFL